MKILISAFEPFDGEAINPTELALEGLPSSLWGADIIKIKLPTVFGESISRAVEAIDRFKPHVVLCLGQAGGRFAITPERVAINLDDARIADNQGNQPIDEAIYKDGPGAYFSSLPVKAIVREIREGGLPSTLSNSAGTYVCNHLMYGVLHHISINKLDVRAGFIHVPYAPEQVALKKEQLPSMSHGDIVRALELALKAIVENEKDIKSLEGKTH